jgi:predicted Zn finger-like uncharacterized protein
MKFHCERCKTKYSIADDRVRGKVLKIRCKHCSEIITVREGDGVPDNAAPRTGTTQAPPISTGTTDPPPVAFRMTAPIAVVPTPAGVVPPLPGTRPAPRPSGAHAVAASPAVRRAGTSSAPPIPAAARAAAVAPRSAPVRPASAPLAPPPRRAASEPPRPPPAVGSSPGTIDWFVSVDGEQEGPMSLEQARAWIARHAPEEELYGWNEGFDAWAPIEEIAELKVARRPVVDERTMVDAPAFAASAATPRPGDPRALYARSGSAVPAGREPRRTGPLTATSAPVPTPAPTSPTRSVVPSDPSEALPDDFEIGEASRVVNLSMLAPRAATAAAAGGASLGGTAPSLPALGRGTGELGQLRNPSSPAFPALGASGSFAIRSDTPRPDVALQPRPRRHRLLVGLLLAGAGLVGGLVVLLIATLGGDADDDGVVRGRVADDTLGYQTPGQPARGAPTQIATTPTATTPATRTPGRRTPGRTPTAPGSSTAVATTPTSDPGEVAIGRTEDAPRPLDGDDLFAVQSRNQAGLQMCFSRMLKRDPLYKAPKAVVSITVGLTGQVSKVSIPALAGTELGTCLEAFIRRWKFPRTTEVFTGQFPVVFSAR